MKCKICGGETVSFEDGQFDTVYHQCLVCEFIFLDDRFMVAPDREKAVYDLHENSLDNENYLNMFRGFLNQALLPFMSKGHVLDYGSGPEPVLATLIDRETDFRVDTYDYYYQPHKVYEDRAYDAIVSTEVVEHLADPMGVFKLFYKHLKPGGILALMTLFHYNDQEKFLKWWYRRDETHIAFYNVKVLTQIAHMVGFEVLYTDNKRMITLKKGSTADET